MIDAAEIARLRAEVSSADLLRQRGHQLRRSGPNFVALCPFHSEKTASFTVFPDGGWKCFGCGAAGRDCIDLIRQLDGLDFVEALRRMGAQEWSASTNWMPRTVSAPVGPPEPPPFLAGPALEKAIDGQRRLAGDLNLQRCIAERRGWRPDVIERLVQDGEMGWADTYELQGKIWRNVLLFLCQRCVKLRVKKSGPDRFRCDGEPDLWRAGNPRGQTLNCDRLRDADKVILTEGETDAISILSADVVPPEWLVIASPGTSFPIWAPPFFRGKEVLVVFDADGPGQAAAVNTVSALRNAGAFPLTVSLHEIA